MSRPRIVLDARPLSHPQPGGFRTYLRSLLIGLGERGVGDLDLILYLDRPLTAEGQALVPPGVQTRVLGTNRLKADWLLFPRQVRADAPDLVHGTVNYLPLLPGGVPTTLNVHDALGVKRYPWEPKAAQWTPRDRLMNRYWFVMTHLSGRRARRIAALSRGAAAEVASALRLPASRFEVVPCGVSLPEPAPGVPRRADAVLAFHSPDARKNAECVYRTFGEFRAHLGPEPPCLEVVCTSEKTAARAEEAARSHGVTGYRLLRGLDDAGLTNAYATATAFLWPSRLEGFGLPPVEAMRCGCPVVSSSAPVMPEVMDDAPVYFDPDRPDELADRLRALLADPAERERRSARGREIAARYTCRAMADAMANLWHKAVVGEAVKA